MLPSRVYFLGAYFRQPLPELPPLWIPRVRCKNCLVIHAVLPAFLFAYMRYTTRTLAVYVEQAANNSLSPIETWNQGLADGPENSETLYRWLRRLRPRLMKSKPTSSITWSIAGRTHPLFTDDVITEIYHHAKGLPRVINTLCYDCLCEIYELQKSLVDLPTLERVLCRYDEG